MRKFLFLLCLFVNVFFGFSQNNALVLNGAYIRLNGGTAGNPVFMVVNQPQTTGIIRPGGGHIHSENQYNQVRWVASTTTGNYVFPFGVGGTAADYIPFEFNKTTAGNANITVSTFSTNTGNIPFATPVSSMPQAPRSIDRFWDIRSTAAVTANLTFRYRGIENTVASCATDTVKAQFWNNPAGPWSNMFGPGNPGVTTGIGTVGSIPGQTYFQTTETVWALTTVTISPAISASANVTCAGLNNGSAAVATTGGLGPYSFSWSPGTNTFSVATGLTPGIHTVTVTGANSCSQTQTINITQPPAITVTVNQTQVTCSALASATISPSGGTTTYTAYTWSPVVSNTNTATGLSAGNYTATVSDSNGCLQSTTVAITSNTAMPTVAASSSGSLNCVTTTVQAIASTTTSPVTYTWTGVGIVSGSNSASVTVNTGGTFNYTVTNTSNGCTTTGSQVVSQNSTVPTSTASTSGNLTCSTTTVALNSTLAGMNYTWTAPAGGSVSSANTQTTIASGAAGIYSLMVVNPANGCVFNTTTSVTQNTAVPTTTAGVTGSLTCSSNTVALNSTLAGMNYTWTAPAGGSVVSANTQSTSASGSPGTYSLTVFNPTNGCVFNTTASVNQNTISPTLTVSASQTISCSVPTVTLIGSATPSTATPVWSGGVTSGSNSYTATANVAGIYTLTVTDPANGCINSATTQVVASTGIPSVVTSVTNSLSCTSLTTQVIATTTASPVSYSWTGPAVIGGANTASATVTAGGQYTVVVTNTASSCSNTLTVSVAQNTVTPITVASSTGTLTCVTSTVDLNSTLGGMNYTWTAPAGGSVSTSSTQATIASGAPGDYTLTVLDPSNGCTYTTIASALQNITLPTGVSAGSGQTLSCSSNSVTLTGSVTTPSNPVINWAGPNVCGTATTIVTEACSAGVYTLTATDPSNGCTATSTVEVFPNAGAPTVTISSTALTIDCNNATQSVTVTSTPSADVIYNWNNTPFSASADSSIVTFNSDGTYICTVTNTLSGCSTPETVIITMDTIQPTISITGTQTLTCASPTAAITLTTTPQTGLTYNWSSGSAFTGQGNDTIVVNAADIYYVTVLNTANGCSNTDSSQVLSGQNTPTVTIVATSSNSMITCQNPTVTLTASVTPTATYSYTWAPSGSFGINEQVTGPGLYNVIVLDATTGCTATAAQQFTVTGNTTPPTVTASNTVMPCGSPSVAISANASNVSYNWTTLNGTILSGAGLSSAVAGSTGQYEVTVTDNVNGCTNTATVNVTSVSVTAAFSANPTSGTAPLLVNFTNQTPGTGNIYSWNFGDDNNNTSALTNPDHIFNTTGTYTVVLSVTDASGLCSATASVTIDVFENFSIIVPNVFTPNGDGSNDLFRITATGIEELNCDIFDRWGLKLATLKSVNDVWDGAGNSAGTYFFILTAKGYDGKEHKQEGFISLFK